MTNVIDNMVDLAERIANIDVNHHVHIENSHPVKNFEIQNFEVTNITPILDSIREITHIDSTDNDYDSFLSDSCRFSFKNDKKEKEIEDFYLKVHYILNHDKKITPKKSNDISKSKDRNFEYLSKNDLADIFEDTNYNEKNFYKKPEKNFRRLNKTIPKHLIPFWDNRTIVDCDKKQIFTYNYSLNSNSKKNFVQLRKSQEFHWKEHLKAHQINNKPKQANHNIMIYDCSSSNVLSHSSKNLNSKCALSKNVEIFQREARSNLSLNQKQKYSKQKNEIEIVKNNSTLNKSHHNDLAQNKSHQNNSTQNKSHQNNSTQNKSHQNNSTQNKSHQNNSTQNKSHQNNSTQNKSHQKESFQIENSNKNNNSIRNNEISKKSKKIKKQKINDPLVRYENSEPQDFSEENQIPKSSRNKNELCFIEEEEEYNEDDNQDQFRCYKYRDVKKMKIITKRVLSDEIDHLLDKINYNDDEINIKRKELNNDELSIDPLISNNFDENIHDPKIYFMNHPRNKKFDDLCSFDISEVTNKLFHRKRNPIIHNPNEFSIIDNSSDDF